ncbi:GGDEF domain-containing protein [Echinimonas agarilytica]|uniref:diguanylate cyclase n=1 Tax=Echinimonas agarilytica TaxID=1215918 RepID=A0AA41W3N2_9GAMM|nr:diguanylate cyclase [Echinimonas agarilytica]MCM2678199.1 diguanylate cyclase [Echinimonas agarilytica]
MLIFQLTQHLRFIMLHHLHYLVGGCVGALVLFMAALSNGTVKPEIQWLDAVGEGVACLFALIWLLFLLCSRPSGRITHLMFTGCLLYWYSTVLDFADEFVRYPEHHRLFQNIESLSIPLAMLMITVGLFEWLREQRQINRQLRQREMFHREYRLLDPLTQVYTEPYLIQQLQRVCGAAMTHQPHPILFVLDIRGFAQFNMKHGMLAGDQLLKSFAELLLSHSNVDDLVCRCRGNRFALLVHQMPHAHASRHMEQALKKICHSISTELEVCWVQQPISNCTSAEALVRQSHANLDARKHNSQLESIRA